MTGKEEGQESSALPHVEPHRSVSSSRSGTPSSMYRLRSPRHHMLATMFPKAPPCSALQLSNTEITPSSACFGEPLVQRYTAKVQLLQEVLTNMLQQGLHAGQVVLRTSSSMMHALRSGRVRREPPMLEGWPVKLAVVIVVLRGGAGI